MISVEIDKYGTKRYYLNSLSHRLDGPAVELANGEKYWYYHDKKIDCNI